MGGKERPEGIGRAVRVPGKLDGKVALVTGAGRGLGRAYALHLAKLGAQIAVNDISLKAHEEFDEEIGADTVPAEIEAMGVRSKGYETDVTDREQVDAMVADIDQTFGRLDILVNNAGGALFGRYDFKPMLDLNFHGTVNCCEASAEVMKRQKSGKIVNVGSQAGRHACEPGPFLRDGEGGRHPLHAMPRPRTWAPTMSTSTASPPVTSSVPAQSQVAGMRERRKSDSCHRSRWAASESPKIVQKSSSFS